MKYLNPGDLALFMKFLGYPALGQIVDDEYYSGTNVRFLGYNYSLDGNIFVYHTIYTERGIKITHSKKLLKTLYKGL